MPKKHGLSGIQTDSASWAFCYGLPNNLHYQTGWKHSASLPFFIAVYFAALPFESDCFCSALHVDMLAVRGILVAACGFCKQALTGSLPPTEKIRRHAMIVLLRSILTRPLCTKSCNQGQRPLLHLAICSSVSPLDLPLPLSCPLNLKKKKRRITRRGQTGFFSGRAEPCFWSARTKGSSTIFFLCCNTPPLSSGVFYMVGRWAWTLYLL